MTAAGAADAPPRTGQPGGRGFWRRRWPLLLLAAAGALLSAVTVLWVLADSGIAPPTDSAHHLFNALAYSRAMHLGGPEALWQVMRATYVGWPPASYLLVYGPLGWLLSEQSQLMRLYGLALLPLLLWGTYRVGADLASRRVGALAALLTIFSFGVAGQLRQVSIDLPATTAVLLAMVALLRSRRLTRRSSVLLLGAACGLCLFTRVQSLFFIGGPILLSVAAALWRAPGWRARWRLLGALALAAAIALAISSPWWLGKLDTLWRVLTEHLHPGRIQPRGDPGFGPGLLHYAAAAGKLAGWPVALAALATLPVLLARCRRRGALMIEHLALLALVLGGILGASAGIHREPRYLLPAVPHLALLAALGLNALRRRRLGELLSAGLLLATVVPTLWTAVHPLSPRSPLVRRGLVEWAYVRRPKMTAVRAQARDATRRAQESGLWARTGTDTYLLLAQDMRINYLPRLCSFMIPMFPDLAFGTTLNARMANTPWHLQQRRRRKLFLMTEVPRRLDLPLLWWRRVDLGDSSRMLRLYAVPPGHQLHGRLRPHTLR